ncbi:hypothetical protein RIE95_05980 [Acidithiobacillus thiooxidans]|uniref:hypothetical protein n=1 Tax=Acidithiobacillus thiooxidans TaxID=930 RepID=UPI00285AC71B|nr:hypothetical protein [Acidithiobacillus thiooxidans]MDR7926541.1 hypothetical protein [Acidithiobacillus thiooxidans]
MDKNVNFRMHEGTFMVIEANAKKNHQTVSDWLRHAVEEQIKRTVNDRALDRIDECVYDLTKSNKTIIEKLEKLQREFERLEIAE